MNIDKTKPNSDAKAYRLLQLETGLEVLLVDNSKVVNNASKDTADDGRKAAAAMCVCTGSFADPMEAQGMAHFLEHMLFMGIDSDKYPNSENLYDAFITSHGGSCNAMTDGEYTVYQFDVTAEHFVEALDIFAHCFKSPSLSMSSADREIKAIDSEFQIASMSDGARLQQLLCDAAVEGHVLRKFSWGNMESLSTLPKANHVDIHAMLRAFYQKHYVPSNMKLVVIGPKSLDVLEEDVKQCFGDWMMLPPPPINNKTTTIAASITTESSQGKKTKGRKTTASQHSPHTTVLPHLLSAQESIEPYLGLNPFENLSKKGLVVGGSKGKKQGLGSKKEGVAAMGSLTRIIPIKRVHKLMFTWSLPSTIQLYKSKPLLYLSHLLGHEGVGSLLSMLKAQGLATGVSSGASTSSIECNSMFSLFGVSVSLTVKGRQPSYQCHISNQYNFATYPINTTYQHALLTHLLNTKYPTNTSQ